MIAKPMAYVILEIIARVYVVYYDVIGVLRGGKSGYISPIQGVISGQRLSTIISAF
jgi:hypothetical protein